MEDDFEARMAAIRSGLKQEMEDKNKQKEEDRKKRSREDTESLRDQFGYSGIMPYLYGEPTRKAQERQISYQSETEAENLK